MGSSSKAKVNKVDLGARSGNQQIKLKTETEEDFFGMEMSERKEISGMQLMEIPFSGMHRLP